MMTDRQQYLFQELVEEYILDAKPIGSKFLAERLGGLSSATIRNEMAALEDGGWMTHPHTSAGRIPTEKGYRYYVDYLMKPEALSANSVRIFRRRQTIRKILRLKSSSLRNPHRISQKNRRRGIRHR